MRVAGRFRAVRRKDHAVPDDLPRPLTPRGGLVEVRVWSCGTEGMPMLLVSASRKAGRAVARNRFRRRVRMAFLDLLRGMPPSELTQTVVWVRPSRTYRVERDIPFEDLKGQLRLALSHWMRP